MFSALAGGKQEQEGFCQRHGCTIRAFTLRHDCSNSNTEKPRQTSRAYIQTEISTVIRTVSTSTSIRSLAACLGGVRSLLLLPFIYIYMCRCVNITDGTRKCALLYLYVHGRVTLDLTVSGLCNIPCVGWMLTIRSAAHCGEEWGGETLQISRPSADFGAEHSSRLSGFFA